MLTNESRHCHNCRDRQMINEMTHLIYSLLLIVLLGLVNLPCGYTHIASVLENDGVPGIQVKMIPRGPTVAPVPSPETLDHFEQISKETGGDDKFFNPANAIRNLLSFSSSSNRLQGTKRLSQFHGNGDYKVLGSSSGSMYRPSYQNSWDYDDHLSNDLDEEESPTFVPFIGARALTNIPEFFAHLKENLEALPRITDSEEFDERNDDGDNDSAFEDNDEETEMGGGGGLPKKDHSKPASRRMKTELHVDENLGRTTGNNNYKPSENNWSSRQNWKPHAAGQIHYYSPKASFIDSQQNILRRANNYNPAWLYTNLGLGKRRR